MFESLVADILNKVCSEYLDGLDAENLNLGIWKGDVQLENLDVKPEALDSLELPIIVKKGHVKKLKLVIPWSNLKHAPVVVLIEGLDVLAVPKSPSEEPDERKQAISEARTKLQKLEVDEVAREARSKTKNGSQKEETGNTLVERLTERIIDNLQVTISDIHIRYEDIHSTPNHPHALGVTLNHIAVQSTNSEWSPQFVEDAKVLHKLLDLSSLSVYWDTKPEKLLSQGNDGVELLQDLKSMMPTSDLSTHSYILKPMDAVLRMTQNKNRVPDMNLPKFTFEFVLEQLSLALEEPQFQALTKLMAYFANFGAHSKYRDLRPAVGVHGNAKLWWKYAYGAACLEIRRVREKWTWKYMKARRDDRKTYVSLYQKQMGNNISEAESEELDELEIKLSFPDLKLYRSLAHATFKKVKVEKKKKSTGWFGGMFGGKQKDSKDEEESSSTTFEITDEQRRALFDLADLDADAEISEVPPEARTDDLETEQDTQKVVSNIGTMKEFFDVLDARKQEYLDDIEFLAFMRSCTDLSERQTYDVFDMFDVDNSGGIEFDEFYLLICMLIAVKDNVVKQFLFRHWRTCFELLDADGGKTISTEEFQKLGFLFGFGEKHIRELFNEFDVAGDQELDATEFRMFTLACVDRTSVNEGKKSKTTKNKSSGSSSGKKDDAEGMTSTG